MPPDPPRRESRTIPATPRVERESDRPSIDSDRGELFLRELRGVEQRTAATTQKALADLSAVYERELARRDELIRELQAQGLQASQADLELGRELTRQRTELTAMISSAVTQEVSRHFVSPVEAKTIAQGESKHSKAWSGIIASIVAVVITGATAGIQKSCSEPSVSIPETRPRPAGTGFAGQP